MIYRVINIAFIGSVVVMSSILSGCGDRQRPEGMPDLYPCMITITQDGVPLSKASVTLISESPDLAEWASGGITDESGRCDINTRGKYRGCPAGIFKVTVKKIESDPSMLPSVRPENITAEQWSVMRSKEAEKLNEYQLVEHKYTLPTTTDLNMEILMGKNSATFDVGKPVRKKIP